MQSLQAVIFDLGGVLVNINYKATERALENLLGPRIRENYSQVKQSRIFDELETGHVTPEIFRQRLQDISGQTAADHLIDAAWSAMIGVLPRARMEYVRAVAANHRVFLFSNINAIHKTAFEQIVERDLPGEDFDSYFEAAYYSHLVGMRKPHPETYTHICSRHGLDPATTLFIDDNLGNVEGARTAGLQAFHLQGELLTAPWARDLLQKHR